MSFYMINAVLLITLVALDPFKLFFINGVDFVEYSFQIKILLFELVRYYNIQFLDWRWNHDDFVKLLAYVIVNEVFQERSFPCPWFTQDHHIEMREEMFLLLDRKTDTFAALLSISWLDTLVHWHEIIWIIKIRPLESGNHFWGRYVNSDNLLCQWICVRIYLSLSGRFLNGGLPPSDSLWFLTFKHYNY